MKHLLGMAGLPEWILEDGDGLLPTAAVSRFLNQAARREGIEALGLRSGLEGRIEGLGVLGRMTCASPTLGDALRVQIDNQRAFSSHGRTWLRPEGADVEWCRSFTGVVDDGWRQIDHYLVMLMIDLVRLGAGPEWRPAHVRFQSGESRTVREVAGLADVTIAFAQPVSAITFPRAVLRAPLRARMPARWTTSESIAAWRASAPGDDFVGTIAQVVETLSWGGYPRLEETAHVLGVSTRTLQRHLSAYGIGHETLVEQARLRTAAALLVETDTRILDVALDVGYSDHAHFTRAFRRWTGTTPMQFRRTRRSGWSGTVAVAAS